jgi:hypothetical protein
VDGIDFGIFSTGLLVYVRCLDSRMRWMNWWLFLNDCKVSPFANTLSQTPPLVSMAELGMSILMISDEIHHGSSKVVVFSVDWAPNDKFAIPEEIVQTAVNAIGTARKQAMMKGIVDLFAQLNQKYNPDFWSEIELPQVAKTLDSLSEAEWDALSGTLNSLSENGQVNLAEACGFSAHPRSVPTLVELLKSSSPQVGAEVAIRLIEKDYVWNPQVSILADLKRHRSQNTGYALKIIDRLISRLPR